MLFLLWRGGAEALVPAVEAVGGWARTAALARGGVGAGGRSEGSAAFKAGGECVGTTTVAIARAFLGGCPGGDGFALRLGLGWGGGGFGGCAGGGGAG